MLIRKLIVDHLLQENIIRRLVIVIECLEFLFNVFCLGFAEPESIYICF